MTAKLVSLWKRCQSAAANPKAVCNRFSALLLWGIVLSILNATATQAEAGCAASPFWDPEVVVARVIEVPSGEWTFGNPPKVVVEVEEVLQGTCHKGRMTVLWGPAPHDIDTTDRIKELEAWKSRKMEILKIGTKWIIWGKTYDGVLWTRADGRLVWSTEKQAQIREAIVRDEEAKARKRLDKKESLSQTNAPSSSSAPDTNR